MQIEISKTGETTIPEAIRDSLGLRAGGAVEIGIGSDGRAYLQRVNPKPLDPDRWDRLRGTATTGMTTDEIMAITRGEE